MNLDLRGLTVWLALGVCCLSFADAAETAVVSQSIHPVLIRNAHSPLLQVVIDSIEPRDVRVKSLVFRLDGTDDLGDLESLALFSTGNSLEFASSTLFGEPVGPSSTVTFVGEQILTAGRNVFWLSCRMKPTANLSHRVAATCSQIETSTGRLALHDASPGVRHRIGVALRRHNDDGVHTYRIPALATSAKGTLLCAYDMRRRMRRDLQEDIDIGLSRSTDGGQNWEAVRVIMDMGEFGGLPQEQNGCSDPGLIVDHQTGEIFCFAVWMNGKPGKHQWNGDGSEPGFEIGKSAQFLMVRSKDDGLTWSKPENLTRKLKRELWWLFAPSPQQGIQLVDGTLVMPSQGRNERGQEFSTIMISRDHGATWTVGTPAYVNGSECQVVQLGDGSLMLNMRNEAERFRAVFTTSDFGQTWQPHATNRNTLVEPNCNGSLLRFDYDEAGKKKHILLFANPHSQTGRTHHTLQVSFDDGLTWPKSHHKLLDEGRGAGYPSLTRVDDQHVGIVYEGSQSHLVFEKFSLPDLLRPSADSSNHPLIVAHRGLLLHAPENTLSNFRACLELRLGFEFDVERTKDGHLVCIHDSTVDRTTGGTGTVSELTLESIRQLDAGSWFDSKFSGERVPTVEEVLKLVAAYRQHDVLVAVDLKAVGVEQDVVRLAEKHDIQDRLIFIGRTISEPEVRDRILQVSKNAHAAAVANNAQELPRALAATNADWVYVRYLPSKLEIDSVHRANKRVFIAGPTVAGLTADNWLHAAKVGIDAILTDYPLELRSSLQQPKLNP